MAAHLTGLNPEQQQAVLQTEGPLLVLAGAGTGKTRVVTSRIVHLVSKGVPPTAIGAVTFTNKAAKEMAQRASTLLHGKTEGLTICTFHSLGVRLLRDYGADFGIPKNFTIADSGDQQDLVADALREIGMGRDQIQPKDAHFKISMWKNGALGPEAAAAAARDPKEERIVDAYERYEQMLRDRGLVDFDDLILLPLRVLERDKSLQATVQARWRYWMVDEYQDTNATQYHLMRLLAGSAPNLCCVGDDDQSIYGWRGAEPDRILKFTRDFPGAKVVALEQNYRSTMTILSAANRVIGLNSARRKKKLWSALGTGQPITLFVAPDDREETDWVGRNVATLVAEGHALREIAVLFRANRQCRPLEQALRTRQIPYRVLGTFSFFDRREVRDLLAYARAALNDRDDPAFLRIVNTPARGIGKTSVDVIKKAAGERRAGLLATLESGISSFGTPAREGSAALLSLIRTMREQGKQSARAAFNHIIETVNYRDYIKLETTDPLERQGRLAVLEEFLEAAGEHDTRRGGGLAKFVEDLSLRDQDKKDENENKDAVSLLTVHASKGLEYRNVFIVGCEEGLLPHQNSIGSGSGDDDLDAAEESKGIEEERRLFYVAVTRARERLWLSRAAKRVRFGKEESRTPSRFLMEMGDEGVIVEDGTSNVAAPKGSGSEKVAAFLAKYGRKADGPAVLLLLVALLLSRPLEAQATRPQSGSGPTSRAIATSHTRETILISGPVAMPRGIRDVPFDAVATPLLVEIRGRLGSEAPADLSIAIDGVPVGTARGFPLVAGKFAAALPIPPGGANHVLSLRVPTDGVIIDRIALIPAARIRFTIRDQETKVLLPGVVEVGAVDGLAPPLLGPLGGSPRELSVWMSEDGHGDTYVPFGTIVTLTARRSPFRGVDRRRIRADVADGLLVNFLLAADQAPQDAEVLDRYDAFGRAARPLRDADAARGVSRRLDGEPVIVASTVLADPLTLVTRLLAKPTERVIVSSDDGGSLLPTGLHPLVTLNLNRGERLYSNGPVVLVEELRREGTVVRGWIKVRLPVGCEGNRLEIRTRTSVITERVNGPSTLPLALPLAGGEPFVLMVTGPGFDGSPQSGGVLAMRVLSAP